MPCCEQFSRLRAQYPLPHPKNRLCRLLRPFGERNGSSGCWLFPLVSIQMPQTGTCTRCLRWCVFDGTNQSLPFWCPTAVGRLARPDRASSAGCAAQELNILNILLTPGGCATFRAGVRRCRAGVRRYRAGVRRFRLHQYLFSLPYRRPESGLTLSIRRRLPSACIVHRASPCSAPHRRRPR